MSLIMLESLHVFQIIQGESFIKGIMLTPYLENILMITL